MARKILLADDSVTAQNMGRKILVDAGYEVIAVNNGSAALKKIAEIKPDLAILDVYMPGYSGLEVCQRLKESHESARIPVLLTVGKLEPFKPEEAQRVRAEGYIVKPFEASELLSALSKLEDKVVPRAEPSKPGRFARAIATAEETSRGEAAIKENGWKSRIGFPRKKTEPEEPVADESSTYNPLNRDLRTVVETAAEKAEGKRQPRRGDDSETVDVAALAPSSLPNDVTPQEVAAIAAAVAKMQMTAAVIEDDRTAETTIQPDLESALQSIVSNPPVAEVQGDTGSSLPVEMNPPGANESSVPELAAADQRGNGDERLDKRRLDEQGSDEKEEPQDVPVTMAATTEFQPAASGGASRWTAVAVALESEESGISLEQEMQKAYAAAEPYLAAVATMPETTSAGISADHAQTAVEAAAAITIPEAEAAPTPEPVLIAAPAEAETPSAPSPAAQSEVPELACSFAAAERIGVEESANAVFPRAATAVAAVTSHSAPLNSSEQLPTADLAEANHVPVEASEPSASDPAFSAETISANSATQAEVLGAAEEATQELPPAPKAEAEDASASSSAFALIARDENQDQPAEPKPDTETVKDTAAAWANWRQIRDTGKSAEMQDAHSEPAQRNDSGLSKDESKNVPENVPVSAPLETAAAVAAGAEQIFHAAAPAEPSATSSDVASIVDSVLAGLRPKLMEEISRKMAEKK